jgi:protein-disulfide isomerase
MKNVSWIIALIVGLAIGYLVAGKGAPSTGRPGARPPAAAQQGQRPSRPQEDPNAVYRVPVDGSVSKGPADALVTIVESSDFECPFCKRAAPTLKQVEEAYAGKLRIVFKHNPLPMHSNAGPAANAAEAAGQQGKFWPMHDKLFAAASLDRAALEQAATELGLDLKAFKAALDGQRFADRISRDQALVRGVGAGGTPTFFINGRKLVGAQPFERFKAVIDQELAKAQALVAAGTPAAGVYDKIMSTASSQPVYLPGAAPQPAGAPAGAAAPPAAPQPPPPAEYAKVDLRADDPARGPADAKVTLVLFSDFQCPFCGKVEPTIAQLEQEAKGALRVVWKHRPLPMHPNARGAAAAAEAARAQGKFWPMHDKLFASQQQLSPELYERAAGELGLNLAKFKASLADAKLAARIDADDKQALAVGAGGTPTMFLNCRKVVGALPAERLRPILQEELAKADKLLASGVKGPALYERACADNVKLQAARPAPPPPGPAVIQKIDLRPDDPIRGSKSAPVTVVLFSDFQCPYCSRVEPTLKQVLDTYGGKVRVAWKHQPLGFHPNAMPAAEAAEAAREQGKFWEMHDALFQNQQSLSAATYERLAQQLGLNVNAFKASIAAGRNRARIAADQQQAARVGANGTPTMFVNGEKVEGAVPFEMIKAVIDRQLAKASR